MQFFRFVGEYVVGLLILIVNLLVLPLAAVISLLEFPKYWRKMKQ